MDINEQIAYMMYYDEEFEQQINGPTPPVDNGPDEPDYDNPDDYSDREYIDDDNYDDEDISDDL